MFKKFINLLLNIFLGKEHVPFAAKRLRQVIAYWKGVLDVFESWLYSRRYYWLLFSFLIVLVFFLISRLPYFLYYQIPYIQPDTSSYWVNVWQIENGQWPVFSYRTPGFPMFMYLVYKLISPSLFAVILVQNLIALFASLFMVYSVFSVRKSFILAPLAGIGMGVFLFSSVQLAADFSPLTESIYTSLIVMSFASVILGLYKKWNCCFILSSVFMALSISVRPTGQFLIVTYLMILLFLIINRKFYKYKRIISYGVPFPLILLIWLTYNYATFGKFKLTDGFEITLICGTGLYLAESPDYSPELNAAIRKLDSRVLPEDREIIRGDCMDFNKIRDAYYKGEYWDIGQILSAFKDENIPEYRQMHEMPLYKKVALHSIKENFSVFFKVYMMNLDLYFFGNMPQLIGLYRGNLPYFYDLIYIKKHHKKHLGEAEGKSFLKEYYYVDSLPGFVVNKTGDGPEDYKVEIVSHSLTRLHQKLIPYYFVIFRNATWPLISILICFFSGIIVLLTRFRNVNAFVLLILTSAPIGHSLICSVFSNTLRFSSPTIFVYYLSVFLFPVLFSGNILKIESQEASEEGDLKKS
jgi:hypothetical protein